MKFLRIGLIHKILFLLSQFVSVLGAFLHGHKLKDSKDQKISFVSILTQNNRRSTKMEFINTTDMARSKWVIKGIIFMLK